MSQTTDRRKRRSQETQQAVTYQLQHVRDKFGFDFLAVGDQDGFYVGGATEEGRDKVLAAYAPAIAGAHHGRREQLKEELVEQIGVGEQSGALFVREFGVGEQPLFLCAIADSAETVDQALEHTMSGIARIIRTT